MTKTMLLSVLGAVFGLATAEPAYAQVEWGMTYEVRVLDGVFLETRPDGTRVSYDDGSGPDFKVVVRVDGRSFQTGKVQDSNNPVWNFSTRVVINEGSQLSFQLVDVDMMEDDDYVSCSWKGSPTQPEKRRGERDAVLPEGGREAGGMRCGR